MQKLISHIKSQHVQRPRFHFNICVMPNILVTHTVNANASVETGKCLQMK